MMKTRKPELAPAFLMSWWSTDLFSLRHFQTPKIGRQSVSLKINVHNIDIMAPAPNLNTNAGETYINGCIFTHRQSVRAALQHIFRTFSANDRVRQAVFKRGGICHVAKPYLKSKKIQY